MTLEPIRVTKEQACQLLAISRNALTNLVNQDPTFPKPIKMGCKRQSPVYFDYQALKAWHNSKQG